MENTEINNSTYPFKNCPSDILRLIFEAAVTRDEYGFKTAKILSHVSQYWRTIALNTPYIWQCVTFPARQPPEDTTEFLKTMRKRMGKFRVLLVVKNIILEQLEQLHYLDLNYVIDIEGLRLHFGRKLSLSETSLPNLLNYSGANLKRLDLIFEPDSHGPRFCDLGALSANLQHLHVDGNVLTHFRNIYPTIQHLSLRFTAFRFTNLVECFPNVAVLKLDHIIDPTTEDTPLQMSHLTRFYLYRSHPTRYLRALSCPGLTEFWCEEIHQSSDILVFLDRNRTITSLKVLSIGNFRQFADAAHQLQHLTIVGLGEELYSPPVGTDPLLPHLQTLTITDCEFQSVVEFEALVRARCLPFDHQKSELLSRCQPLEVLGVVLVEKDRLEDTILADSELVKEARVWTEEDETSSRRKVCMSWES